MADERKLSSNRSAAANAVEANPTGFATARYGPSGSGSPREPRTTPPGTRKYFRRKKVCKVQVEKIDHISYRDVALLRQFISDPGKIMPRRLTGTSHPFQRRLTRTIKQARNIALLPFASKP